MKKQFLVIILGLMIGIVLAASSNALPATTVPSAKVAAMPQAATGWEKQWDTVLEAGKKEGEVVIYSLWRPETRTALTKAFLDKYGIKLQFLPFTKGSDLLVRAQKEKQAGLYAVDVFGAGNPTLIVTMKPASLLGSLKPLIILP